MKTEKIKLTLKDVNIVDAQAPLIVSASRATDVALPSKEHFPLLPRLNLCLSAYSIVL